MADAFKVLTSASTVQLTGTGDTEDVVKVWIETTPSQVRYVLYVADNQFTAAEISGLAGLYSPLFEKARHLPGVQDLYPRQDVNAAGDLVDHMVFVLASDDGRITEEWVQPQYAVAVYLGIPDLVAAEVAKLNAIAGL